MPQSNIEDPIDTGQRQRSPDKLTYVSGDDLSDRDADAALACAALELMAALCDSATIEAAGILLVNRVKSFLRADGVALGLVKRHGGCRLAAIAGAADIDPGSELSAAVDQALGQIVASAQNDVNASRSVESGHRSSSASQGNAPIKAVQRLQSALGAASIELVPLRTNLGQPAGAVGVWGREQSFDRLQAQRFLRLISEPLAGALSLYERASAGRWRQALRSNRGKRRSILCLLLSAIALGVLFLLPYRITCDCAAEPRERRFVSAPFAGVFEKSLVRPGDVVAKDQLLGQMDGRELRIELAGITADYERVRKSYDVDLAAGKVAAAQIDKLELERLDQQRQLLAHRMANLEIRSPVAGYVISGDLERTQGAPLTVGQILFEIAPLEAMIVELAIDDDNIAQVDTGQTVSVRFEAYPGEPFVAALARIHPRSETRDSRNVFIGEVVIDNADASLRPGMKGIARIVVEGESLASALAKRAWHAVGTFLAF